MEETTGSYKVTMQLIYNDRVTYSWCEVIMTAVTRRIVDSREMTRSSEDVHFIVAANTESLTTALLPVCWTIRTWNYS